MYFSPKANTFQISKYCIILNMIKQKRTNIYKAVSGRVLT